MPPPPPLPWQPAQPYLRKILRPSTTASPCLANGLVPGGPSSCTTLAAADPLPSALDELLQAASSSAPQITSLDVMVYLCRRVSPAGSSGSSGTPKLFRMCSTSSCRRASASSSLALSTVLP